MIDLTGIEKDTDRKENKVTYAGKRIYLHVVELAKAIHAAKSNEVTAEELGIFGELKMQDWIDEARRIGDVPKWNDENLAKFEYTRDVYRER